MVETSTMQLTFIASLLFHLTVAQSQNIYHRIHLQKADPSPWTHRATLQQSSEQKIALTASAALGQDIEQYLNLYETKDEPGALYQVALEREGDINSDQWAVSSVKAVCLTF